MSALFELYISKKDTSLVKSNAYKEIIWLIKKPTTKAECQFVVDSLNLFKRFTEKFHIKEPLANKTLYRAESPGLDISWTDFKTWSNQKA